MAGGLSLQQPPPPYSSSSSVVAWQRIPGHAPGNTASIQGIVRDPQGRSLAGAKITVIRSGTPICPVVTSRSATPVCPVVTDSEGVFRLLDLPLGNYQLRAEKDDFAPVDFPSAKLDGGELLTVELQLQPTTMVAEPGKGQSGLPGARGIATAEAPLASVYTNPLQTLKPPTPWPATAVPGEPPAYAKNFSPDPNRWDWDAITPPWDRYRYGSGGDYPYTKSRWYDPFNRNLIKGDKPIIGQNWFLNVTGTSISGIDVRRLPVPSSVSAEQPNSEGFFGKGEQFFASQSFRFSFDLFQGDASFRPIDFRIRITPEVNLNFLQTRERGLVNVNVQDGINRFDTHTGIQEAFVEAKIHDLSPNFDFVSVRAGIQQFVSDFRGFLFSEEQPGIRVFGNLRSNRINYNLAYFYFLEKDTNSGLNTFNQRHQQVYIANVYIQDFLTKGYTTQFSFHYNRDDPSLHYDENGFLVRPSPIGDVVNGNVIEHGIRAYYLGWTGNGHIKRLDVNHAFYQALGYDTFNPIAGRRVDIDAQMGALELSLDKDWVRYYTSFFYASGDSSYRFGPTRSGTAHGFDTIVDDTNFAGGTFSFFDQQGIMLTSTGVNLTNPASLLASLRSNKEEGQANFVNPGIYIFNAGADFNLTTNLRGFANASYLRFDRTEPLEILLFQNSIRHSIGEDIGFGVRYRPKLNENIVVTAGTAALFPGAGLDNLYNSKVLLSGFATLALTF
ncbi:MAG: carboxypeptidase-like regulatory domain-containing protein [Candidatus Korobacteraceae bacterium]